MKISSTPQNSIQQKPEYDKYKDVPEEYMNIAKGMEAQFINHMLTELDKTITRSEEQSGTEQYYNSLLNNERSQIMAEAQNNLGIRDLILGQIYPGFNKNLNKDIKNYQGSSVQNTPYKGSL